jgi:hypothetical protein
VALKDYDTTAIWAELERRNAPLSAKVLTLTELLVEAQAENRELEAKLADVTKVLTAIRGLTSV